MVNQMDGSVVITSVKIIYHMNTVGRDVLRVSCPNNIENLTRNLIFQQGKKVVITSNRGEGGDR